MSLCLIRQYRISSALDEGRELSSSLKRHIGTCRRCRQFLEDSRSLDESLAAKVDFDPPAWLHTRVMAKIGTAGRPVGQERLPSRWFPALAGAAGIAIVAGIIAIGVNSEDRPPEETATAQLPAPSPPVHPASVTAKIEEHAKLALTKEAKDLAADLSGAKNFFTASLRSTIPLLGGE